MTGVWAVDVTVSNPGSARLVSWPDGVGGPVSVRGITVAGRSDGRWSALLDDIALRAAVALTRRAYVSSDSAVCARLREHLGDLADVERHEHAPRGGILEYPAGEVPVFRPAPGMVER